MRAILVPFALMLISPLAVRASCDTAAPPAYEDITYVNVSQFSLVGQLHPWYTYEATYYPVRANANVSLDARRAVPFRGSFVSAQPVDSFKAVVQILKTRHFFDMRLHPSRNLYIDGPEDAITISRCGVTMTLGVSPHGELADLDDAQAQQFFALLNDLRANIFQQKWEEPHTDAR